MPTLGHFSMTFIDRTNRSSVQRVNSVTLTAGNIVAQTAAAAALLTDTVAMSLGTNTKSLLGNLTTNATPTIPTSNDALRSNKFAVSYHDTTTGDKFTTQIPVANFAATPMLAGTRLLDLTVTPTSTYVTDFVAFVKSEEGNNVAIDQIRAIGRHI